jgi:hypothetical protein
MHLPQSGVDITVSARRLGHEGTATRHRRTEANLAMKEQVLTTIEEMPSPPLLYRADDELLRFLEGLQCGHAQQSLQPVRVTSGWRGRTPHHLVLGIRSFVPNSA